MSRSYFSQRVARTLVAAVGVQPAGWIYARARLDDATADGGAVGSITDAAGGSAVWTQATGGLKPTLILSNGPPRYRLSRGSGSRIISATGGTTGAHTMLWVGYVASSPGNYSSIMTMGPDQGKCSVLGHAFNANTGWGGSSGSGAGQTTPQAAGLGYGALTVMGKIFSPGSNRWFQNGAQPADIFADPNTVVDSAAMTLGGRWTAASLPPDCDTIHAVWFNQALTGAQYNAAQRFLTWSL